MKFYRVNYYAISHAEQTTEWVANKAAAEKIARENKCGDYDAHVKEVEVPTDKAGLLAFLNENISTWPGCTGPWGGEPPR